MNPFDGLTPRQSELVKLALEFMRLTAWGGESPPPKEKFEYDELLEILGKASFKE
jgi:hypothetical protein